MTTATTETKAGVGRVVRVIGPVVDVEFPRDAMPPIFNFGTEEQKQRWLVPGIAGEKIGALGITEPGAGSDVAGLSTTAKRDGDRFIVNGATPAKNSALASAGAEMRFANGVSLLAKFDGEFAGHSQTYAGTGTLRVSW